MALDTQKSSLVVEPLSLQVERKPATAGQKRTHCENPSDSFTSAKKLCLDDRSADSVLNGIDVRATICYR